LRVVASPPRLAQVFINVLVNAAQAMSENHTGTITVVAEPTPATDGSEYVRIEIRDDGHGIPTELLPDIFKPFFTTKPPGEGTGLGLSICRSIVEGFGGQLGVESTVGVGTTVWLELERADATLPEIPTTLAESSAHFVAGTRVLVVDDDPQILRMVARVLSDECEVVIAADPERALALARGSHFDLVLLDLVMPRMNGVEVLSALLDLDDSYRERCLMMTGGRSSSISSFPELPTLQKPFGMRELRSIVRARLEADKGAA
jgi:hypothetical protein